MHPPARSTKALVIALGAGLLVVGIVGVIVLRTTGLGVGGLQGAADRLEDWLGSQIVGITNSYLVPQIAYDELDYQAPGTIQLTGVTFTAPDGTRVLEVGGMIITLAEAPKIGEPIRIERVELDHPTARLIREVGPDGKAGFRGLSPIVKNAPTRDDGVEHNFRLSTVLRLREVEFIEGSLLYDQGDGSPPMEISGFTTTVLASPDETEDGWYSLDIESAVGPLANLALVGQLNLDDFKARVERLRFAGELSPESAGALPPQLQALVRQYDARGQIELTASGELPLTDPVAGTLTATLDLTEFGIASGDYQLPIESVHAEASLAGGVATLSTMTAAMLRGEVRATAEARLAEPGRPAVASWTIDRVELRELLRADTQAEGPPPLAGEMVGSGSLATRLDDARAALTGDGQTQLRKGRVILLPGLTQLAALMRVPLVAGGVGGPLQHKVDAEFTVNPAGVEITASQVTTEFLVARATGAVGFDRSLDLAVNAGPMEKLQSLLGRIGNAIGSVTDRLVRYRVRGTVSAPTVSVDPLGLGG